MIVDFDLDRVKASPDYNKVKEILLLLIKIKAIESIKQTLGSGDANSDLLTEIKQTLEPWGVGAK
jgi:hypothetical protein